MKQLIFMMLVKRARIEAITKPKNRRLRIVQSYCTDSGNACFLYLGKVINSCFRSCQDYDYILYICTDVQPDWDYPVRLFLFTEVINLADFSHKSGQVQRW